MTRLPEATADAVVGAVEAVVAGRGRAGVQAVADFLDLPAARASEALDLAEDLMLVRQSGAVYESASPLARLLITPVLAQKAALLRVAIEDYEPFRAFRRRLWVNGDSVNTAAQQVKALLGITAHRDVVKGTLLSLGTYCQSLRSIGGDHYEVHFDIPESFVSALAGAVSQMTDAELRVRDWLREDVRNYVDDRDVLEPLAGAYLKVSQGGDARGAVVMAGNATESYLAQLAGDLGVNVAGAHGLGAKVAALESAGKLPKKVAAIGRYLGNVRNGADHGVDPEVGAAWTIRDSTGEDFLRVAVSFMEITFGVWKAEPPAL